MIAEAPSEAQPLRFHGTRQAGADQLSRCALLQGPNKTGTGSEPIFAEHGESASSRGASPRFVRASAARAAPTR